MCHPREGSEEKLTPMTPPIEHPSLRVFCCMQDIVERKPTPPDSPPYAINGTLTGPMSLYLSTPRADYLKGSLVSDNCK